MSLGARRENGIGALPYVGLPNENIVPKCIICSRGSVVPVTRTGIACQWNQWHWPPDAVSKPTHMTSQWSRPKDVVTVGIW